MAEQNRAGDAVEQAADIVNQPNEACAESPNTEETQEGINNPSLQEIPTTSDSIIDESQKNLEADSITSEKKPRIGMKSVITLAATLALTLAVAGFAYAAGEAALKDGNDSEKNEEDWITLNVINSATAPDSGYVAGSSCTTTVKVVNSRTVSHTENAYVRVHIAIPAAVNNFDENNADDILNVSFGGYGGTSKWTRLADYATKVDKIDYNVAVFVYKGVLASGSATDELTQSGTINTLCDVDTNGRTTVFIKDGASFTCNGSIPVLLYSEAVQADAWNSSGTTDEERAIDILNTAFGTPGTYTPNWANATA